ncbi:MAG TPA: DUF4019 domain-containing protein [Pseudoxanthomonas sp.]|nr:DUF4019 domain-containing protein [Pseudoxanthomonas sp.]
MSYPRLLIFALMLALTTAVSAQQATPPSVAPAQPAPQAATQQPPTPEQQAQLKRQNEEMGRAALKAAQMVDRNQIGELWDGASSVAKGAVTRDHFVRQLAAKRQTLGALTARQQVAVTRAVYSAGGRVPAGNYINVEYATRFAGEPQPVRELVSFRLDEDNTWRVSGYSVLAVPADAQAPVR